jgi:hypothetical protein
MACIAHGPLALLGAACGAQASGRQGPAAIHGPHDKGVALVVVARRLGDDDGAEVRVEDCGGRHHRREQRIVVDLNRPTKRFTDSPRRREGPKNGRAHSSFLFFAGKKPHPKIIPP